MARTKDRAFRKVPLTRGLVVVVSPEDFENVSQFTWHAVSSRGRIDAITQVRGRKVYMSHMIVTRMFGKRQKKYLVDHWNRAPLDNRRCNLRMCTPSESQQNRSKPQKGTRRSSTRYARYTGVSCTFGVTGKCGGKRFEASIRINGRRYYLGCFDSAEKAAEAYDDFGRKNAGRFFVPNFPRKNELPPVPPKIIREQVLLPPSNNVRYSRQRNSGRFVGVFMRRRGEWRWRLEHKGAVYSKSGFSTELAAAKARDTYIIKNGLPHLLNFPRKKKRKKK